MGRNTNNFIYFNKYKLVPMNVSFCSSRIFVKLVLDFLRSNDRPLKTNVLEDVFEPEK